MQENCISVLYNILNIIRAGSQYRFTISMPLFPASLQV